MEIYLACLTFPLLVQRFDFLETYGVRHILQSFMISIRMFALNTDCDIMFMTLSLLCDR